VLLEILWPETDPEIASNRLKAVMHHLRKALSPDDSGSILYINYHNGCYELSPEAHIWVDVSVFEERQKRARKLELGGHLNEAISLYLEATNLYRGDFLEEDRYEEWTLLRES
jgi:DNA-binding SARP family transcriptional activator